LTLDLYVLDPLNNLPRASYTTFKLWLWPNEDEELGTMEGGPGPAGDLSVTFFDLSVTFFRLIVSSAISRRTSRAVDLTLEDTEGLNFVHARLALRERTPNLKEFCLIKKERTNLTPTTIAI
jgi:hypothetical protein